MADQQTSRFGTRGQKDAVEEGLVFQPKFDADGLIPAIVTAADTGDVLMFAWMNEEALAIRTSCGCARASRAMALPVTRGGRVASTVRSRSRALRMPQCRSSQCSAIRASHDAIALQRLTNFAPREGQASARLISDTYI